MDSWANINQSTVENIMYTIGEYILSTGEIVELLQNGEGYGVRFFKGSTVWFFTKGDMFDFVERY